MENHQDQSTPLLSLWVFVLGVVRFRTQRDQGTSSSVIAVLPPGAMTFATAGRGSNFEHFRQVKGLC